MSEIIELIELIGLFGQQQGCAYHLLSLILSCTLVIVICIRVYQVVIGKANIGDLFKNLINNAGHKSKNIKSPVDNTPSKGAYTNVLTELSYVAGEVAKALATDDGLLKEKTEVYRDLLSALANMLEGSQTQNHQITLFIPHKEDTTKLQHYAHCIGCSDEVINYAPAINGSAAGKAWRTNKPYYLANVAEEKTDFEYKGATDQPIVNNTIFCTPITASENEDHRLGVICVSGIPVDACSQADKEHIMLFAKLIYPLMHRELTAK